MGSTPLKALYICACVAGTVCTMYTGVHNDAINLFGAG